MRTQRVFLLLIALLWLSKVALTQGTANQPIEWIVRETSGDDQWGHVAPDGVAITYSRSVDGQTWQLLVTNRDGQSPRPFLIAPPAASVTRGAWSRQHRRFAFTGSGSGDVGTAVYVAGHWSKRQAGSSPGCVRASDVPVVDARWAVGRSGGLRRGWRKCAVSNRY